MCWTNFRLHMKFFLRFTLLGFFLQTSWQTLGQDSTLHFSGSIGLTTNGFSIIPTFSLNSPATMLNLAWKKKKLSFEPDIRLVPNLSKGSLIWWLRYQAIQKPKWGLRTGAHPAFSLIRREDVTSGTSKEITEMLRFLAFEVVPHYKISPHLEVSAMYLEGHGLQKHGPQTSRVVFLNTAMTSIPLNRSGLHFGLFPTFFYLNVDGNQGTYLSGTARISHKNSPFGFQGTINQTLKSDIPNNQNFMWNVTLTYHFNKKYITSTPN